jgi:septal ring factor EnvC (AmiA/AmiB activator)
MMRRPILLALLLIGGPVLAQTIADERKALDTAQREADAAIKRSQRYENAAAQVMDKADKTRAEAAAIAARIQESEAAITAAQARVVLVERLRRQQQTRLAARQQPITRLAAALQTMARRPSALAIVQPGSLDDMVHARLLLANAVPVIQARSADLRAELDRATQLRAQAEAAVAEVSREQAMLEARRQSLARLESEQRAQSRRLGDSAFLERERAQGMAEKARDITDLMASMDRQAELAADLASLPGPVLRPPQPGQSAAPPTDRTDAALPRPAYRLPVLGRVVTGVGEISETGIRSRGLTFITRPDAQVIAPANGRVKFAESFRDYGLIVIIDHGGGWTTLITGLHNLSVAVGDSIVQGSPVGRAGPGKPKITVELRRQGQPVDIAPLAARG